MRLHIEREPTVAQGRMHGALVRTRAASDWLSKKDNYKFTKMTIINRRLSRERSSASVVERAGATMEVIP
jgi:hypothetical protein